MENKKEIEESLNAVKDAVDFLTWKIDRATGNLPSYIDTIDLQAILVVQQVKILKDMIDKARGK